MPTCAADLSTATATRGPGMTVDRQQRHYDNSQYSEFHLRKGFTISGTVTSLQSGTLQKITFNPTAIATTATAGCNTTATNPCRIEITATSQC